MSENQPDLNVVEMAAEIVSAYVRNNSVPVSELPTLLQSVHESLGNILNGAKPEAVKEPPQPKVPVKKSVTNEYIVCLEDGKRFKSLKRHLHSEHGLSPQEYREKWGLAKDYPMVAPAYADARSNLAKTMGLGRKAGAAAVEMPEPEPDAVEPPRPRSSPSRPRSPPPSLPRNPAAAAPRPAPDALALRGAAVPPGRRPTGPVTKPLRRPRPAVALPLGLRPGCAAAT